MSESGSIERHHHITLCVGTAQEDYDFHTKVLGLKSVKKTALYDGEVPIYHLYYGNDVGLESTLVTTFPMRQSGRMGKQGTNQTKVLMLSINEGSLGYWNERLTSHGACDSHTRAASSTTSSASLTMIACPTRTGQSRSNTGFTVRTVLRCRCSI